MKEKQVNTIDALFREELGSARVQPSDQIWENIQLELAASQPEEAVVAIPWKIWVAAASVGVVLALGLTLLLNRPQASEQEMANNLPTDGDQREMVVPGVESPVENELAQGEGQDGSENPGDADSQGPITPENTTPVHFAPVPQNTFASLPSQEDNQKNLSSTPQVVVEPNMVLVANSIDLKTPEQLTDTELPRRSGHDLDKPYAFYSPDEVIVQVPDFGKFDEEEKGEEGRWAVGGVFSPDFALNQYPPLDEFMTEDAALGVDSYLASARNLNSQPSRAFSSGVNFAYAVSKKVEVQSGVTFSNRTSTDGNGSIFLRSNNSAAVTAGERLDYSASYSNTFLEVPVAMRYRLRPEKKLDVYLTSGVSTQLHVINRSSVESASFAEGMVQAQSSRTPLTPYQLNGLVGAGVEYKMNDQLSLALEPVIRKAVVQRGPVIGNPNLSVSVRTGMNYHF